MSASGCKHEVNSDDEFIVPPMKRARTVVGGGKHLFICRIYWIAYLLSNQYTSSHRAPPQSTLPILGYYRQICVGF